MGVLQKRQAQLQPQSQPRESFFWSVKQRRNSVANVVACQRQLYCNSKALVHMYTVNFSPLAEGIGVGGVCHIYIYGKVAFQSKSPSLRGSGLEVGHTFCFRMVLRKIACDSSNLKAAHSTTKCEPTQQSSTRIQYMHMQDQYTDRCRLAFLNRREVAASRTIGGFFNVSRSAR